MNQTIEMLLNHRSVRKFKEEPISEEVIMKLVEAAQMASTSSFIQAYSIIGIKDEQRKRRLAELAGEQNYVAENGHFFVFCADFHRHEIAGEMEAVQVKAAVESAEKMIVGITDATLAAQNCAVAAESLGLGICYIGGIRNNIEEVSKELHLPDHVIPVFGMCVGIPDADPSKKPRLPKEAVYFEETYPDDEFQKEQLEKYNNIISSYYEERTNGERTDRWTEQMVSMLSSVKRKHMKSFLRQKGYGVN
ncbi:oxygen-insensitive NADPH nitroreductase [Alkalicoccus halolimnae]|uniref:Oxygen-insensitive NADPH nitroreductase n=1 Tax=Alkalicoccus halolimnae TaxID=1667239 RepID=A0A5C7FBI3_9BACI|nr:oxygen-insensitive NADPH nitroreductase [Alkalicoccus halolimnae]TXF87493.1 oxygen-insensitive NADPH nitroreductase [Alkalicoccus halolimnae]